MARVQGLSMVPTLAPGELLWVRYGGPIVLGDIAVFRRGSQIDIKRISKIEAQGIFVMGDNDLVSTDSRSYGLIPHDDVLGTTAFRIWPKPGRVKG